MYFDYIIVGSGIAGLYTALLAREFGSVLVVTKGNIDDCNTKHAQGGIAAAIAQDDSPELHLQDTLNAGAGLCDINAVQLLVEEAPARIADLIMYGVPFDTTEGAIALTREAAHSTSRILHAGGDATGEHIEVTLSRQVKSSGIKIMENSLATRIVVKDGIACGLETLDCRTEEREIFDCRFLVLATGGGGRLYKYTTNSDVATGDGVVIAYEAGAEITDMEFFQFHPTALKLPGVAPFLISEAVRGEGGILRNIRGERFMPGYTPETEMAPRDVVARSILAEMQKTESDHVLLDVTHLPPFRVTTRFPQIYRFCREQGLTITKEGIPVAPAAHYMMGGVKTNTWGETNIPHLFAVGEVACTGVHGANRLASNSLMETLIFGKRIVLRTEETLLGVAHSPQTSRVDETYPLPHRKGVRRAPPLNLSNLQTLMWERVGIVRDGARLLEAAKILSTWERLLPEPADRLSYELYNLVKLGRFITEAAIIRHESRGAHYHTDFPRGSPQWLRHIIFKKA